MANSHLPRDLDGTLESSTGTSVLSGRVFCESKKTHAAILTETC